MKITVITVQGRIFYRQQAKKLTQIKKKKKKKEKSTKPTVMNDGSKEPQEQDSYSPSTSEKND